jgi:hypothetical protein
MVERESATNRMHELRLEKLQNPGFTCILSLKFAAHKNYGNQVTCNQVSG